MAQVNQVAAQIRQVLEACRADLVNCYSEALGERLSKDRTDSSPSAIQSAAMAEVDALVEYIATASPSLAAERGRAFCDDGASQATLMALASTTRHFCLERLPDSLHVAALDVVDSYFDSATRGYLDRFQQRTLLEQEQVRSSLQKDISRRTMQMRLAADIARATTSTLDLNNLLAQSVDLIRGAMDLYFAAVFLVDDYRQWAILRAGTGEAGKELAARGYRLGLREPSPVATAIENQRALVISNVDTEKTPFRYPLLDERRAEIITPLVLHGDAIGVLVVQSDRTGGLDDENLNELTIISDQLANAIENAELYARAQASLKEAQVARGVYLEERRSTLREPHSVFVYDLNMDTFAPADDWTSPPGGGAAPATSPEQAQSVLSVPLVLRDQTLGAIELYDVAEPHAWSDNDVSLANAVASQAALALDNARLYEAAQQELVERKRAEEETLRRNAQLATLYELGQRLAAVNDPVQIAMTVHEMLGRVMDNANFYIAYYDDVQNTISFPIYSIEGQLHQEPTRPFSAGLTEYVISAKNPLIVLDNVDETLERLGVPRRGRLSQSIVAVPLMLGERVLGVMTMQDYYRSNVYSAPDIALFSAVAGAVSSYLDNARLYSALNTELGERKRAQTELQQRLRETMLFNRVTSKAATELEPHAVLQTACDELAEFFATNLVLVGLLDAEDKFFNIVADHSPAGQPSPAKMGARFPIQGVPLFHQATLDRAPIIVADTRADARVAPIRPFLDARDTRSFLLAPLFVRDRIVGSISVGRPEPDYFKPDQLPVIQSIATTISQSLANARLYESLQQELTERQRAEQAVLRRNEELAALNRITAQAAQSLDVRSLVKTAAAEIVALFNVRNSGIALLDAERTELEVVADATRDSTSPGRTGMIMPVEGNPIMAQVLSTGKTVLVQNVPNNPEMGEMEDLERNLGTGGLIVVPLWVRGQIIGTIGIDTDDANRVFTQSEVELAETIASQIAGALENARLFEQVQEHATQLEKSQTEIEASLKEKELLLKEIHHRVKNNLQVVISLLNLESARVKDPVAVQSLKESQTRIRSMALIHEKLYQSKDFSRVDFDGYVRNLASYLFRTYKATAGAIELNVQVHDVMLGIDRAIPCGLIINELVTNSLKYAFPEGRAGRITVELHPEGEKQVLMRVADNGVGFEGDLDIENSESLGMQLVSTLTNQLGGQLTVDGSQGANFTIMFPIQEHV